MSDTEDDGMNPVLSNLMEQVDDALYKADEGSQANALKRLRGFLLAIQGDDSIDTNEPASLAAALRESPRPPGFSSYPPGITKALREAVETLEKA